MLRKRRNYCNKVLFVFPFVGEEKNSNIPPTKTHTRRLFRREITLANTQVQNSKPICRVFVESHTF
jgi:hypothetical protein